MGLSNTQSSLFDHFFIFYLWTTVKLYKYIPPPPPHKYLTSHRFNNNIKQLLINNSSLHYD